METQLRQDLAAMTTSCKAAEASVAQLQQQVRDLSDREAALQVDLTAALGDMGELKSQTQIILQDHIRLEAL